MTANKACIAAGNTGPVIYVPSKKACILANIVQVMGSPSRQVLTPMTWYIIILIMVIIFCMLTIISL